MWIRFLLADLWRSLGSVAISTEPASDDHESHFIKQLRHNMISFKGRHFQQAMILQSIRWYLAYSLSYRDIQEIMMERGFDVDHSTIQRSIVHFSPVLRKYSPTAHFLLV